MGGCWAVVGGAVVGRVVVGRAVVGGCWTVVGGTVPGRVVVGGEVDEVGDAAAATAPPNQNTARQTTASLAVRRQALRPETKRFIEFAVFQFAH